MLSHGHIPWGMLMMCVCGGGGGGGHKTLGSNQLASSLDKDMLLCQGVVDLEFIGRSGNINTPCYNPLIDSWMWVCALHNMGENGTFHVDIIQVKIAQRTDRSENKVAGGKNHGGVTRVQSTQCNANKVWCTLEVHVQWVQFFSQSRNRKYHVQTQGV